MDQYFTSIAAQIAHALIMEPAGINRALDAYHEYGDADGILAARRLLGERLRGIAGWPRDEDYRALADAFAERGDVDAARLLREIAAAGPLLAQTADRWIQRYADRTDTPGQEVAGWLATGGYIDFDPDGPYPGIDGADYRPGCITKGLIEMPAVLVTTRAMKEVITGWDDYEQMRRWVASRGSTGSGDLDPSAAVARSRLAREERVLARLLTDRGSVPEITALLPPVTFTADVRHDLYTAVIAAARRDPALPESLLRAEFTRRLARVPGHALPGYAGPGADTADRYRRRLTATVVSQDDALDAAWSLRDEDRHAVRARAYQRLSPGPAAGPQSAPTTGLRPPPPVQGPGLPEPRM